MKQIGFDNCCISEITLAELMYGVELSDYVSDNMKLVNEFAKYVTILPIFNSFWDYTLKKKHD